MKKRKKELTKLLKEIIDDLMDNYEKYNELEKNKIEEQLSSMIELNKSLDKYDSLVSRISDKITKAFHNFFGKN